MGGGGSAQVAIETVIWRLSIILVECRSEHSQSGLFGAARLTPSGPSSLALRRSYAGFACFGRTREGSHPPSGNKKPGSLSRVFLLAEREGFEPSIRY